jgi:hypothetical protein
MSNRTALGPAAWGSIAGSLMALVLATLVAGAGSAEAAAAVHVVTQAAVAYPHFTVIQDAVNAAAPGDWVLIDQGVYAGAVYVTTPNLHIRGMDRNLVIVDGQHQVGNGIEVWKADGVSIENLTVRNFDRPSLDGADGNQIWWNGGDGSGTIGLNGWYGRYLTTYSDGLLSGYGIFTSNSVTGLWDNVYASGFNDSGLYLGACRDCRAKIRHALVENNALGYSGTNSGGHIILEKSTFRNNSTGIGPNSLNNDDQPPPQDGACDAGLNDSSTPAFLTTHIRRCTIIRKNVIENNGNLTTPANTTTASIPWGNGIILIGTYADLVKGNTISNNPSAGLLGLENPDPFPPTPSTVYFQLSGNRISGNQFQNNGTPPDPNSADITLLGGLFGTQTSVNNCLSSNRLLTSSPANIQDTWGCRHSTTPNPGGAALAFVLTKQAESQNRTSVPQPAPPPQPSMPKPCKGVPKNPLCP